MCACTHAGMHACLRLDARVCGCMHGEHSPCAKLARATRACTHACTCVCAWMHACVSLEHPPWEELTIWGKADRPRDGLQRVDCRRVDAPCGPKVQSVPTDSEGEGKSRFVFCGNSRGVPSLRGVGVHGTSMYRVSLASQTKAVFGYKPTFSLNQRFLSCPHTSNRGCRQSRRTCTS